MSAQIMQKPPRRFEDKTVTLNPAHYRPGTVLSPMPICFPVNEGGLGDFLCYVPALQWIAEECPHVYGTLLVHAFILELAHFFFDQYPHWKVDEIDAGWKKLPADVGVIGPAPGMVERFNPMSSHMIEVGWIYYVNTTIIPTGWNYYPDLTELGPCYSIKLPEKYVVFTTGGTTPTRQVPGSYWNPIIEHVIAQGFTPVFLGKSYLHKDVTTTFGADTRYDLGVDLRDRTGLLEAAAIMKYAHATIGLDNGLLHLAACTGAVVIFGYNIAAPETRRPRMKAGRLIEVLLDREELGCIGCQSNMKLSVPHDFRFCMYTIPDAEAARTAGLPPPRSPKCIEMLFADSSKLWIDALSLLEDKK